MPEDIFKFEAWIRIPGLRGGYFNRVQRTTTLPFAQAWLRDQRASHPEAVSFGITDLDTLEPVHAPGTMTIGKGEA